MTRLRALSGFLPAALLGAGALWAVLLSPVPPAVLLVGAGLAFIALLPRFPRQVVAFSLGGVLMLGVLAAVWTTGWGCASEVDGRIVEHDCGDPALRR